MEYRAKRLQAPVIRHGKPLQIDGQIKTVSFPTVNRELAFLRYLLNLAEDDGIIETAPRVNLKTEKDRKRERVASDEEYKALLANMKRPAQRVLICLYESAMRLTEGIAQQAIMAAAGHHSIQQNNSYVNMKEQHQEAFKFSTPMIQANPLETQQNVSY